MNSKPNILLVSSLLPIAIFLITGPLIASEGRALNGNVYVTSSNGDKDTITFTDGSFQSTSFAERGFSKGTYTTMTKGNKVWFEAKTVSPHNGEVLWTGVIDGNAISGSYLYTQKGWFLFGDTTKKMNFNGNLKIE